MAGKIAIYQVLPRLFGNTNKNCIPNSSFEINGCGKLNFFDKKILSSIKSFGYTHIWFTGVIRHATITDYSQYGINSQSPDIVKGIAGSPYAVTDYYDISPDLSEDVSARMDEFESLIKRCHQADIKVIIDFIPNHLSRAYKSVSKSANICDFGEGDKSDYPFHPMNNFYYIPDTEFNSPFNEISNNNIVAKNVRFREVPAKVTGNDCFSPSPRINDWYDTVKLNYGMDLMNQGREYFDPIPDTWIKMREVLEFWAGKGVDGFRCDMASMVPLKFWNWAITSIKERYSDILFIAEIYEKRLYDQFLNIGKFDYLYDKVGLYDTLRSVTEGNSDASEITACWSSLNGVEDKMLNFLENHDEQRIASDFFAGDPFRAIPALTVVLMLNRAPFLIYFGQELGERGMEAEGFSGMDGKTTIFDYWSVSTVRSWIESGELPDIGIVYKKLINIALTENSISSGLKYDLMYANRDSSEFEYRYIYSFIRKADDSLLLILVNFSHNPQKVTLRVPYEAFTHLKIESGFLESGVDIFSESSERYTLSHEKITEILLNGFGVKIIKFLL